ncbi:MAG: hypothetical protein LBJ32_00560 [Oscillospiraceae bacterium]|jgi:hypothetical protein|nr:hypothetical protein [Oscillospiraceae bacterium]
MFNLFGGGDFCSNLISMMLLKSLLEGSSCPNNNNNNNSQNSGTATFPANISSIPNNFPNGCCCCYYGNNGSNLPSPVMPAQNSIGNNPASTTNATTNGCTNGCCGSCGTYNQ